MNLRRLIFLLAAGACAPALRAEDSAKLAKLPPAAAEAGGKVT